MRVSTTVFQNAFGKYLKMAMTGEDIIISKSGRGVAKLIQYEDPMITVMKEGTAEYYVRKRVTYQEYLEITENTKARYELINGEIFLMPSVSHQHQVAVRELLVQMHNWFEGKACQPLSAPYDVKLSNGSPNFEDDPNVVFPDILVICDEDKVDQNGRYQGVPTLIVEVMSPTTRCRDLMAKVALYANSGVQEYWIVDLEQQGVLVYALEASITISLTKYRLGELILSEYFKGLEIDTSKFASEHLDSQSSGR